MALPDDDRRFRSLLVDRVGAEVADELLERLTRMSHDRLVTKDDLTDLRGEFTELRGELFEKFGMLREDFGKLREDFGKLREDLGKLREDLGGLRGGQAEIRGEISALDARVADRMRMQTWLLAGLMSTGIAASATVVAALG